MREVTIARSYAEALFELAERHGQREEFAAAVETLARLLEDAPEVRLFLETPQLDVDVKTRALRDAMKGRFPPLFVNFVLVVLQKRRQRLLREIAREYREVLDERLGRVHVDVTVARPLGEETVRQLAERLNRSIRKSVVPHVRVQPEILGGVIVRYGDHVLDGSLRRQLIAMRDTLMSAELP